MKNKIIALLLVSAMALSITACGNKEEELDPAATDTNITNEETANEETAEEPAGEGSADVEAYEATMSKYIESFENAMKNSLAPLVEAAGQEFASDEDVVTWCQTFIELKETLSTAASSLAEIADIVPEGYQESHTKITIATAAVVDAMTGFEASAAAAAAGDQEAFINGLAVFVGNIEAANTLWDESVVK